MSRYEMTKVITKRYDVVVKNGRQTELSLKSPTSLFTSILTSFAALRKISSLATKWG